MPPRRAVICRPGASRGCPEPDARCFQPRRPRQENSALPSAALGGAENKGVSARFQLQTPTLGFRTCSFYMSRNNTLLSISARAPKYVKAVAGSRAVGVRTAGGPRGTRSPTPLLRAPRHRPAPRPGAQPPRARAALTRRHIHGVVTGDRAVRHTRAWSVSSGNKSLASPSLGVLACYIGIMTLQGHFESSGWQAVRGAHSACVT